MEAAHEIIHVHFSCYHVCVIFIKEAALGGEYSTHVICVIYVKNMFVGKPHWGGGGHYRGQDMDKD
jgi:hypothetical protein